mmetsp:Transcript_7508/g.7580  ORF Transcript_7508/g.7580 Transcript_7508/m.7580 type:complete len:459 (+) Transcript_7508:270-1646(+)|eukprot:CAMPEP_0119051352 /NCGR_PEP_ID=MMETSP1177-20130426/72998_1 /TAXON_ID=2985 /ORGANISM="Ochromonas sp, Strain CCMP1899" /LENGTH=458 /DNA_ID=CAMNT_0007030529 /DNA_START=607 /DNA_END=1983 /DNA_ORIENTATION=-
MDDNQKRSSLFVGNLSMFIKEVDIESLFGKYSKESKFDGEKIFANIIRTELGVSRGYGFIDMRNEDDAKKAMMNLQGKQFHGRPLKVKYSERKNSNKDDIPGDSEKDRNNSVHVRFSSTNREYLITEETILYHFSKYGKVVDVCVKNSEFNKLNGLHKGYAFVHFEENAQGTVSAIQAMTEVSEDSLVLFECQPSHNLTKQLEKLNGRGLNTTNEELNGKSLNTTNEVLVTKSNDKKIQPIKKKSFSQNLNKFVSQSIYGAPSSAKIVSQSAYSAPSSSSLQTNGDKYQVSQGSNSSSTYVRANSSPNDDQQSLQLVYPYPHHTHVTPFMSGPNHGPNLNSPGYMVTENQHVNNNMQQHVRQQYDDRQMNFQNGYPSHYYPGDQSLSRYSTEFSYQQPYVAYSMNPVSYLPIDYNEPIAYNDQYDHPLQYQQIPPNQIPDTPRSRNHSFNSEKFNSRS